MEERRLEISASCDLVVTRYGDPVTQTDVDLFYIEHQCDGYYSDFETTVEINKEMAEKIIAFLRDAFNMETTC